MVQTIIDAAFLGSILIPIFILFIALNQNLLEILRSKQKIKRKRARAQSYYTGSEGMPSARLRVIK